MQSDETIENAWMRARAACECECDSHHHRFGQCDRSLVWQHRGRPDLEGAWEVYRTGDRKMGGWEAVNCCQILCWACYERMTGRAHMAAVESKRPVRAEPLVRPVEKRIG